MTTSTAGLSHFNLLSAIVTRPLAVLDDVVFGYAIIFDNAVRLSLASLPLKMEKQMSA
jgi:hypothetical protein